MQVEICSTAHDAGSTERDAVSAGDDTDDEKSPDEEAGNNKGETERGPQHTPDGQSGGTGGKETAHPDEQALEEEDVPKLLGRGRLRYGTGSLSLRWSHALLLAVLSVALVSAAVYKTQSWRPALAWYAHLSGALLSTDYCAYHLLCLLQSLKGFRRKTCRCWKRCNTLGSVPGDVIA